MSEQGAVEKALRRELATKERNLKFLDGQVRKAEQALTFAEDKLGRERKERDGYDGEAEALRAALGEFDPQESGG